MEHVSRKSQQVLKLKLDHYGSVTIPHTPFRKGLVQKKGKAMGHTLITSQPGPASWKCAISALSKYLRGILGSSSPIREEYKGNKSLGSSTEQIGHSDFGFDPDG